MFADYKVTYDLENVYNSNDLYNEVVDGLKSKFGYVGEFDFYIRFGNKEYYVGTYDYYEADLKEEVSSKLEEILKITRD